MATFDRHLKKLVHEGTVTRKSTNQRGKRVDYFINLNLSNRNRKLENTIENHFKQWENDCKKFEKFIELLKKVPKDELKKLEKIFPLYGRFVKWIVESYNFLTILAFTSTSSWIPPIAEKKAKQNHVKILSKLEILLGELKVADVQLHKKLCLTIVKKINLFN